MNRINRKFNICKKVTMMKIRAGEPVLKLAKGYCFKSKMVNSTYHNPLPDVTKYTEKSNEL